MRLIERKEKKMHQLRLHHLCVRLDSPRLRLAAKGKRHWIANVEGLVIISEDKQITEGYYITTAKMGVHKNRHMKY